MFFKFLSICSLVLFFFFSACTSMRIDKKKSCEGNGDWNFGLRDEGPLEDERFPFIEGKAPKKCRLFTPMEKKQLLKEAFAHVKTEKQPVATFVFGPPGSGKSSRAFRHYLKYTQRDKSNFVNIDADEIRAKHPEFISMTRIKSKLCTGKYRSYSQAVSSCLEAPREVTTQEGSFLEKALSMKKSFAYYGVSSSLLYSDKMALAKKNGFKVDMVLVWAPLKACQDRVRQRSLMIWSLGIK